MFVFTYGLHLGSQDPHFQQQGSNPGEMFAFGKAPSPIPLHPPPTPVCLLVPFSTLQEIPPSGSLHSWGPRHSGLGGRSDPLIAQDPHLAPVCDLFHPPPAPSQLLVPAGHC